MKKIKNLERKNKSVKEKNNNTSTNISKLKGKRKKIITKKTILFVFIPIIASFNLYFYFHLKNHIYLELKEKIKFLEFKIAKMDREYNAKKKSIAFVYKVLALNGISRFLSVLTDLLAETGKYNVYLINEVSTEYDFPYNKKVKREIIPMELEAIKKFDKDNDIKIYILNNNFLLIDIIHSLGKKIIFINHGVFFSNIFEDQINVYNSWKVLYNIDSLVHVIPDDYWIYKKLGFKNTIYIPNIVTFESKNTPSSKLTYKNILMVTMINDVIKGLKYGLMAMVEIIKEVPDAKLIIIGSGQPDYLNNLIKKYKLQNHVEYLGYSQNITEFYLNASVLLITSVSEAYPMVLNEGKAHGLPIVAFNLI